MTHIPDLAKAQVTIACYALVMGRFADMLNPEMRGRNFSWERFPEMMKSTCSHEILCYFHDSHEWSHQTMEAVKYEAERNGLEIASNLMKRAGDNLPL